MPQPYRSPPSREALLTAAVVALSATAAFQRTVARWLREHPLLGPLLLGVLAAVGVAGTARAGHRLRAPGHARAARATHTGRFDAMAAGEFEQAIADLCRRDGCTGVRVVGGAGDLGADVTGKTPDGRHLVIQCKRYGPTSRVGSQDAQRFGGTCYTVHRAQVAVIVTTSTFTGPAIAYAAGQGIRRVDGAALAKWASGTGPRPW